MMTTEDRILAAVVDLLEKGGMAAVTTRAVCQAAAVTAPTLYHHFTDKTGLLRAVAMQGVRAFMTQKRANLQTADALADLRRGWDSWIEFALERPQLFRLMVETTRLDATATREAFGIMRMTVARLATAGRLSTDVDTAARTIWAAANGVISLIVQNAPAAEVQVSGALLFEAIADKIVV